MPSFLFRIRHVLITAIAFCGLPSAAQGGSLFDGVGTLSIELRAPLTTVYSERRQDEREKHAGTLHYSLPDGQNAALDVDVRTRGNFRRLHCNLAPLRLYFSKTQVVGTPFEGERKLKLVSPCRKGARYEELIVSEYLAYRIYALLSDYHFRVRPLAITFTDSDGEARPRTSFAFLIEDLDNMAARYGRYVPDWKRTHFRDLEPRQLAIVEMFQFMVGGHDWSVVTAKPGEQCCHNSRLIVKQGSESDVIPIPYDFDLTGLVNAPYAFPPEIVPIDNVRQRYFRGRCRSDELWQETFAKFRSARPAINALFSDSQVKKRLAKRSIRYLDDFYKILDDPARLQRMVIGRCANIAPAD